MQQHPVPQHIASYEFRLIGEMTLKQFGLLAGNCVVALLFYASNLPGYFKWPVVLFFVLLGVAMAFLPIEERPLHRWIIAFFKAVYSPTQFLWRKKPKKLTIFEATTTPQKILKKPAAPKADRKQLTEYLQTLPGQKSRLEQEEENYLAKIGNLFQAAPGLATVAATPTASPQPKPSPPLVEAPAAFQPKPAPPPQPTPPPVFKPPVVEPPKPAPSPRPAKIEIEPEKRQPAVKAKTSLRLPFPKTPQTPNLLVGMVLDPKGEIIEDAIIEIRNSKGMPVRALKTNKLGQFLIMTPLKNDVYEIETEKEGYTFDIIKIELKGAPVLPIEIRAKGPAHGSN